MREPSSSSHLGCPGLVLSRNPAQVREIVKAETDIPLNTDDRPLIEFHAARNFITGVKD